jgi:capsular exopolysaccharide synthesis family protein
VDPTVQALRERLGQVSAKLASLTEKYTDRHPLVRSAQGEVEDAQERLKAALAGQQVPRPGGATTLRPTETAQLSKQMATLEVELMSLQSREASLQQRIALLKRSSAALGVREQEYSALARSLETQARLATMLTEKLTAARISEQTHIRNVQVIDLATLPVQPSPKKLFRQVLLGLIGGLGVGLGVAFLRERASQVVETEEDAATSGLPILGSVPIAPTSRAESENGHPKVFVATSESHSLPADACRAIRTALDCKGLDTPIGALLVTSPGAHDGKSTVLLNLALAFAEAGRRVLVIDADMRRPTLHKAFEVPNELGLADMLRSGLDWAHAARSIRADLAFLPSGAKVQNPGGLLSSRAMAKLMAEARERADIVLVDSPPLLAVSDALPLTGHVDGVVLVARFGATRRGHLVRVKEQLERVRGRVMGVVINGLSPRETRRYYAEYDHYVGAGTTGRKRKQTR